MKTFQKFNLLLVVSALCVSNSFALSVSLTVSTHGGYNISCFGGTDGSITANPSGGTAPYTYLWSNTATTQTISNLAASYYAVTVTDANNNTATAGGTLREPTQLNVTLTSSAYSNGYNVSCFNCYNGSITNTPSGGVLSYTYLWVDGATTQNRSSIGGGQYTVKLTDGNGCTTGQIIVLSEPARDDWTMLGNAGSNPPTQYIGTADNKDLVFKTNGTERMRIKAGGGITTSGGLIDGTNFKIDTLRVNRIIALPGDSVIRVGDSTLYLDYSHNRIYGTSTSPYRGTGVGLSIPYGLNSVALGNKAWSQGENSVAMGYKVQTDANASNSIVIGHCYDANSWFTNNVQNSLMVGFNTSGSVPTLYVGPGNGTANAIGKVAIGTSSPSSLLEVKGAGSSSSSSSLNVTNSGGNSLFYVRDDGKVGIGTTNVTEALVVKGDIQLLNDNTNSGELNALQIVRSNSTNNYRVPARRGISIDDDGTGGGNFDFWIHGYQDHASFNFRDGATSETYMTINKFGRVGIGTTSPSSFQNSLPTWNPLILHLKGQSPVIRLENTEVNRSGYVQSDMVLESGNGYGRIINDKGCAIFINANGDDSGNSPNNSFSIWSKSSSFNSPGVELFKVNKNGVASARAIKVTAGTFPDYVFEKGYTLKNLKELEQYVYEQKHLPNIPSASEVKDNGLDVGEMNAKLLEKVEELTLYIIDLQKQIDELKQVK